MRQAFMAILLIALVGRAGARSTRQQCTQACGGMIGACTQSTTASGFLNLTKACKQAVLKRCRKEGVAVCGPYCGNGVVDGTEVCDGTDLRGASCASMGLASGGLACAASCGLDTSGCTPIVIPPSTCGNGVVDFTEQCDGTNLAEASCASLGLAFGTLRCTSGCAYDTAVCAASTVPSCGNGVREPEEQCEGDNFGGFSCSLLGFTAGGALACGANCAFELSGCANHATQRFPETGQTTSYQADKNDGILDAVAVPDDGAVQAGQSLAYVDHGDGTLTDLTTGLMWEKKGDAGDLHDKDGSYVWSGCCALDTIWDWLQDVNAEGGTGFAGHNDWRIPNVKELQSLVSYGRLSPAVEPALHAACAPNCTSASCSCTGSVTYWSSSTYLVNPGRAWLVSFSDGSVSSNDKTYDLQVRAVRGGS
jgi:Protein of unknown function (DUF1566)